MDNENEMGMPSERQLEALKLVATGLSVEGTAQRMEIAQQTVKHHLSACRRSFGVDTTIQAILLCLDRGIFTFDDLRELGADWLGERSRMKVVVIPNMPPACPPPDIRIIPYPVVLEGLMRMR